MRDSYISKQKEGPEWERIYNIQRCDVPFSFKMTYVSWVIMNFCRSRLCPFWSILSPRPRTRVFSGGCPIYTLHKASWSMDESATVYLLLASWTKRPRLPLSILIHLIYKASWSMDESATVYLLLVSWTKSPGLPLSILTHPIQLGGSSA